MTLNEKNIQTLQKQRTVLIGVGGHASVVIECLMQSGSPLPIVAVDANQALHGTTVFGIPVLGSDSDLEQLVKDHQVNSFLMGIGSVGEATIRETIYRQAASRIRHAVKVIHPSAVISPTARLSPGVQVMPRVVINSRTNIGENVIINSGAIIEHDCRIGNHVHVAPGAVIAGNVAIGNGSHVGCGATLIQSIRIGNNAIVGAGAVVTQDVADNQVVVGVPARSIRRRQAA